MVFVRWKRRDLRRRGAGRVFYAVLVESHRVDGKVRQKVLAHLAHIKEQYLSALAHQEFFWQRVDWRLEEMQIETTARHKIERKLAETVPRPPARGSAEWVAYEKTAERLYWNNVRHNRGHDLVWPTREEILAATESEASAVVPTKS
jgi:hypothetical protein